VVLVIGAGTAVMLAERSSRPPQRKAVPIESPQRASRLEGTRRGRASKEPVPILMYHVLAAASPNSVFPKLFVPPAQLAAQTDWLSAHGYEAITLRQLFTAWAGLRALPPRAIVLSFDDGYLSDYTAALPTLRRHHWPGVLDLAVRNLRQGDIEPWQVRRLIAAGWEIAAHTISHVDLTTLGPAQLRHQVAGSRSDLERMFGVPVDFFCYPFGRDDVRAIAAVKAAGFQGATTEDEGLARPSELFTLDRIAIEPRDGVQGLIEKLHRYGAATTLTTNIR
jgi:peptidoglycan/xylan/chitin deacetylase (PgdA/CDA1 family)